MPIDVGSQFEWQPTLEPLAMKFAPLRQDENAALVALEQLAVLDSDPEAEFDALVRAASVVCGTPISLISLIGAERQWFKASVGLPGATESPRDISFCSHAVLDSELFEVEDATKDPRFFDNPFVVGPTDVRFYAGAPVQLDGGEIVGTLCVIDRVPRKLDATQKEVLTSLATAASKALQGRRAAKEIGAAVHELVRSRRELAELNQSLERRIEDRTTDLLQAVVRADAANRAKSEFLSNMSHEIRTPMNGVLGLAHVALLTCVDGKQRHYLQQIRESGKHLMGIINNVLDFAKIEAGRVELDETHFQLEPLFETLEAQIAPAAAAKGLRLAFTVDDHLHGVWIGDALRISQILRNYIDNAIKFTAHGSVDVKVNRAATGGAGNVRFEVRDTGIGLSPAQSAQLFQAFQQSDASTTRVYGGTGLGLAICKRLASLLGGDAGVDSVIGEGSTFWFTALLRKDPGQEWSQASMPARLTSNRLEGVRVLLAEDNPVNREVATALLELAGATVWTAENGQQAVELARAEPFDCILMDVQMPVLDGLDATRAIRSHPRGASTPVIALTANVTIEERRNCKAAGMDHFLVKPVNPNELLDVVSRFVKGATVFAASSMRQAWQPE